MNRQKITDYIEKEFGVQGEYLWMKFPNYAVFWNHRNRKWFAFIGSVESNKLGLEVTERIDIINLKCDPILIGSLIRNNGYLPAYHMSKKAGLPFFLTGALPMRK